MASFTNITNLIQGNTSMMLLYYVVLVIGQWKLFEKAGEEGWKSIIPIYNSYILWKIAGKNFGRFILIILLVPIIGSIVTAIASSFNYTVAGILAIVWSIIMIIWLIYIIVELCELCDKLSKSFGHGVGFTLGLLLFQPIFLMILGFNGDTYQKQ